MTTTYSDVSPEALAVALAHARGAYQTNIILGIEALSGTTLRGEARRWGPRYADSRHNLVSRLKSDPLLEVSEERRGRGRRRVLVIRLASASASAR